MVIAKPICKSITNRILEMSKDITYEDSNKLVREIKTYILQAVASRGIPLDVAEEVAIRLILLIAILRPPQIK